MNSYLTNETMFFDISIINNILPDPCREDAREWCWRAGIGCPM